MYTVTVYNTVYYIDEKRLPRGEIHLEGDNLEGRLLEGRNLEGGSLRFCTNPYTWANSFSWDRGVTTAILEPDGHGPSESARMQTRRLYIGAVIRPLWGGNGKHPPSPPASTDGRGR